MVEPTQDQKITYATMIADQMNDLHNGIDRAIEQITPQFGQTHPMYIDGQAIESAEQFDDCLLYTSPSPPDLSTSRMPASA